MFHRNINKIDHLNIIYKSLQTYKEVEDPRETSGNIDIDSIKTSVNIIMYYFIIHRLYSIFKITNQQIVINKSK